MAINMLLSNKAVLFIILLSLKLMLLELIVHFSSSVDAPLREISMSTKIDVLYVVLLAPIIEELGFRSWLKGKKWWHFTGIGVLLYIAYLLSVQHLLLAIFIISVSLYFFRKNSWILAIASSSMFCLFHLTSLGWNVTSAMYILFYFLSGLFYCLVFLKSNLLWCILFHMGWNFYVSYKNDRLSMFRSNEAEVNVFVSENDGWKMVSDSTFKEMHCREIH